jgi:hypothetical protein
MMNDAQSIQNARVKLFSDSIILDSILTTVVDSQDPQVPNYINQDMNDALTDGFLLAQLNDPLLGMPGQQLRGQANWPDSNSGDNAQVVVNNDAQATTNEDASAVTNTNKAAVLMMACMFNNAQRQAVEELEDLKYLVAAHNSYNSKELEVKCAISFPSKQDLLNNPLSGKDHIDADSNSSSDEDFAEFKPNIDFATMDSNVCRVNNITLLGALTMGAATSDYQHDIQSRDHVASSLNNDVNHQKDASPNEYDVD